VRTEGNPFFIRELLAHLVESGFIEAESGRWSDAVDLDEAGAPAGVRDVVGQRLSRLSAGCHELLTTLALSPAGAGWDALRTMCGDASTDVLAGRIDEAVAAQMMVEREQAGSLAYAFTHALIRQTIYQGLSAPRRAVLHMQAGEALERLYGDGTEEHVAELAHHFTRALPAGDRERAVMYASRAGERAMSLYAWEEAADWFGRAEAALPDTADSAGRARLAIAEAGANAYALRFDEAVAGAERAAALARESGDPHVFARVALDYVDIALPAGGTVHLDAAATIIDEALTLLGGSDRLLRARLLMARLGTSAPVATSDRMSIGARSLAVDPATAIDDAREALGVARDAGDIVLGAQAFSRLRTMETVEGYEAKLSRCREAVDLFRRAGTVPGELAERWNTLAMMLHYGDVPAMLLELPIARQRAVECRIEPFVVAYDAFEVMLTISRGELAAAEAAALDLHRRGRDVGWRDADVTLGAQLYAVRWLQGRLAELRPMIEATLRLAPLDPLTRAAYLYLLWHSGDADSARREMHDLPPWQLLDEDTYTFLPALALSSELCVARADAVVAASLYDRGLSYAGRFADVGVTSFGALERSLGQLAALLERWDDADEHFARAAAANDRAEHFAWTAMTRLDHARMLLARGCSEDAERARELLEQAHTAATAMGMARVAADAEALLAAPVK
jgi:tetratricopeptide (TPR) repeat protein